MSDSDYEAQYFEATHRIGVAVLHDRGHLEITGPDAARFVSNLCTNDVNKLPAGRGCEAFFANAKGRTVGYAFVFRTSEAIWLEIDAGCDQSLQTHLERYHIAENLAIRRRTDDVATIHCTGPSSGAVVSSLSGQACSELDAYAHLSATVAGNACQIRRRLRSRFDGFDIVCAKDSAASVFDAVQETQSANPLTLLQDSVLDALRIEAGLPRYGLDVTDEHFPQEVNRNSQAISFSKGCYLGQETVARIDTYGHVHRRLLGLIIDSETPSASGAPILHGDKTVGWLGGNAFSPAFGKVLGLSILRVADLSAGTALSVDAAGQPINAIVSDLPFVPVERQQSK